jgi:hypothetical protein
MASLLPTVLALHIALAVSLFLPSLLLPFALRRPMPIGARPGPFVRGLLWLQANGTLIIGGGLALTGAALVAILGPALLRQPWLIVALVVYVANLALAFFIQRPNLRRLLGGARGDDRQAEARWSARARRQRYVSYAMAAAVGLIGFLMSAKPSLW